MTAYNKYKRYLSQAMTFGFIWFVFGIIYCLLEQGILGREAIYPSTGNPYNFKDSLLFIGAGSFVLGVIQGWIEAAWLQKLFQAKPLWHKILFKGTYYLTFLVLFLSTITITLNAYYLDTSPFDFEVIKSYYSFIGRFPFWSVVIYAAAILAIALFFSEVKQYIGANIFRNFFYGKYHRPKKEARIFMFLDMKSSTTIAESLGHETYFNLLKLYYSHMSDAILDTSGEIYQYVGDEIVVSWPKPIGVKRNNCIRCFELINKAITKNEKVYRSRFGVVPEYKAGYHIGVVTIGEIGIIKKEIIYTGDVLNTTARIQAECNTLGAKVLLSGDLLKELDGESGYNFQEIGTLLLRGKQEPIHLFKCQF